MKHPAIAGICSVKRTRKSRKAASSLYESAAIMCDPGATSRPRQWKSTAKCLLRKCTASRPKLPKAHALLAYVHFLSEDYAAAEVSIRSALRTDAGNGVYLRLLLTILLAQEKNALAYRWLRKLADLEGVDLSNMKMELRKVKLPTDTSTLVLNAFPNALGWFESFLSDEVDKIQRGEQDKSSIDPEPGQETDLYRTKKFDARKVPRDLRHLVPVALKWGVGDDVARVAQVNRACRDQKRQLRKALPAAVRREINDWLDLFNDGATMTDEVACFMYLLLAYEELTYK